MLRSRKNATGTCAKLDDLMAEVRREAERAEADPFDGAMVAAMAGVAEAMKAEADALMEIETRVGKLARKGRTSGASSAGSKA